MRVRTATALVVTAAAIGLVVFYTPAGSDGPATSSPPIGEHHHQPGAGSGTPGPTTTPSGGVTPEPAGTADVLQPGQKPPQFIVVSFDGAGWHRMWKHWLGVTHQVPFHFTGFLSGTYLLSDATKDHYHPPHLPAGSSAIGWNTPAEQVTEMRDLDQALSQGDEVGTHFNGHFCDGFGFATSGAVWDSNDWDDELDQFFDLLKNVRTDNHLGPKPPLLLTADEVRGERTPCLEGTPAALYPALRDHHFDYDSSFTREGLSWPTEDRGIWQLGMSIFPMHGTLPDGRSDVPVTSMDYNYYFTQRGASDSGLSYAQSAHDSHQVLATYRDMFDTAYHGNRAPLILGNHFNDWNHSAYLKALTTFVETTCTKPNVRCVPFRDLVSWLEAQKPGVLRHLQSLAPELHARRS